MSPETLSNFLAGIYGDLNIAIYSDDSRQEPDLVIILRQ